MEGFLPGHKSIHPVRRRRFMSAAVLTLLIVMIVLQIAGFLLASSEQKAALEIRNGTRDARIAQQALVDAEINVETYVATRSPAALEAYFQARDVLLAGQGAAWRNLDLSSQDRRRSGGAANIVRSINRMEAHWGAKLAQARGQADAAGDLGGAQAHGRLDAIRDTIAAYLIAQNARSVDLERAAARSRAWVLGLQILGGILTLLSLGFEANGRKRAIANANAARQQVESLFHMADLLQSAAGYEDANSVLSATAQKLLPEFGGTLYVFNHSRDRLDRAAVWNHPEPEALPDFVAPSSCWSIKRGKWHLNAPGRGALHCGHYSGSRAVLEMPMMARGELYGLLSFSIVGDDAKSRLLEAESIATALADAMSLALANIGLREKLRNQALRDQLTGLYNRRYMEDMMDRLIGLAERTSRPFSLIMIDLDHFKTLNDEHGHPAGDAALRRAAEALTSGLRDTDVACRYGGEELVVLLPDCTLDDAILKAEGLRMAIEASGAGAVRITASLGVATIPETSSNASNILAMADAALYRAKAAGRNRVMAAERSPIVDNRWGTALAAE